MEKCVMGRCEAMNQRVEQKHWKYTGDTLRWQRIKEQQTSS